MVGMVVTPLAVFPTSQVCLGFQLDVTPGRQRDARSSRLSLSHSRKSGRSFLALPLPARNWKTREWHRKICANSMWADLLHSVLVFFHSWRRNIEEGWWGASPDSPYVFFHLYKNYIIKRPQDVLKTQDCVLASCCAIQHLRQQGRIQTACGDFLPFPPYEVSGEKQEWLRLLTGCPAFFLLTARRSSIWPCTESVILPWMCMPAQTC